MDTISIRTATPEVTPSGAARAERALVLYEERGDEIRQFGTGLYRVPSCSGEGFYTVDYLEERCNCPDFQIPRRGRKAGEPCKHIYAVGISRAARRSGVRVRTISVAGDPFKAAAKRRARTAECAGCRQRFPRGDLVEVQESLTYFEGDLLCEECWHGSDAVVL